MPAAEPWRKIVFADLHVSAATLQRCLWVLKEVDRIAVEQDAEILFLGDFWDLRSVLNVRQLDAVLDVLTTWSSRATFIPGNHDQVDVQGLIHGVRIFEAFPDIEVIHSPTIDHAEKCAYLPWREDPAIQADAFATVPLNYTIFAHAEAPGSIANSGKAMDGRFSIPLARAVYLGHFHKRQLIGDRCWYIGSPYEQNFGERHDPHGCALITSAVAEPTFFDFDEMPKHHIFTFPVKASELKAIRTQDIVEIQGTREELDSLKMNKTLAKISASKVRTLTLKPESSDGAPAFALNIQQGLEAFVAQEAGAEGSGIDAHEVDDLTALGKEILSECPDAKRIDPLSARTRITRIRVRDFCAIRGEVEIAFPEEGSRMLLKGPMGAGKTSLMDSMSWGFFGVTSPRKAGSASASIRADDVIHDDAPHCEVEITVQPDGWEDEITVTRTKHRGKGAKVEVQGLASPAGISIKDQQDQIHHVLGLNYDLWRCAVYLGQGAVANFVTDADKRRKELLSAAFNLGACDDALRYTKLRLKDIVVECERLKMEVATNERVRQSLEETDFSEQVSDWEKRREAAKQASKEAGEAAKESIEGIDEHLKQEDGWVERRGQYEEHRDKLVKSLGDLPEDKLSVVKEIGATAAERDSIVRDLAVARAELSKMMDAKGSEVPTCPTCLRPFDRPEHGQQFVEAKLDEAEERIGMLQRTKDTLDVKISNLAQQAADADEKKGAQRVSVDAQITEAQEHIDKCATALSTLARLRANRDAHELKLKDARAVWEKYDTEKNPFLAKQKEAETRIANLKARIDDDEQSLSVVMEQRKYLEFWEHGFSQRGIPVLVLRTVIYELESYANHYIGQLTDGRIMCQLVMGEETLAIDFAKKDEAGTTYPRSFIQLSGGERRCVELAFTPFALSEMIFNRLGTRVDMLVIDELTTHLTADEKPIVCDLLQKLDRDTVIVIDHDASVQGSFDIVLDMQPAEDGKVEIGVAA